MDYFNYLHDKCFYNIQHIVFGSGLIVCFLDGVFSTLEYRITLVCQFSVKDKLSLGIPTEIEHINGVILKYVNTLNIACAANKRTSGLAH